MRHLGSNVDAIQHKKVKWTYTLMGMFKSGNVIRAQEMIHYALKSVHAVESLIQQQVKWRNSFIFIQKRLNDK